MKVITLYFFFVVLCVVSCTTAAKDSVTRTIFTNDIVQISGKAVGVRDLYRFVYLSSFSDYIGSFDLQGDFQKSMTENLNRFGVVPVTKLRSAQAVVSGSLDSLVISSAERATNVDGLIYTLRLTFSVIDKDKNYLQMNRPVLEQILVLDTNTYESNDVIPVLVKNAGQHTAEAVYHGWQLEYSKTPDKIMTLGVSRETNTGTNRP
jgi:hypothetical protein